MNSRQADLSHYVYEKLMMGRGSSLMCPMRTWPPWLPELLGQLHLRTLCSCPTLAGRERLLHLDKDHGVSFRGKMIRESTSELPSELLSGPQMCSHAQAHVHRCTL